MARCDCRILGTGSPDGPGVSRLGTRQRHGDNGWRAASRHEYPPSGLGHYAHAVGADGTIGGQPLAYFADYVQDGDVANFVGCRPEQAQWPTRSPAMPGSLAVGRHYLHSPSLVVVADEPQIVAVGIAIENPARPFGSVDLASRGHLKCHPDGLHYVKVVDEVISHVRQRTADERGLAGRPRPVSVGPPTAGHLTGCRPLGKRRHAEWPASRRATPKLSTAWGNVPVG
jgi:hypothetical protein